jgi:hypothetical protein
VKFGCGGVTVPCEIRSFHSQGVGDLGVRLNALLAAVPLVNHWLWTRNSTGWEYLSEVAAFWECYLQKGRGYPGAPPGSYSSVKDSVFEGCHDYVDLQSPDAENANPHITLSLLRFLLPVFASLAGVIDCSLARLLSASACRAARAALN